MQKDKLTIGELQQICNVSKRRLRHYDELGILIPAIRDDETNYRYYARTQVEEVLLIKEMQRLHFSLPEIRELMQNRNPEAICQKLAGHMEKVKRELDECLQRYEHTAQLLFQMMGALSVAKPAAQAESAAEIVLPQQTFTVAEYPVIQFLSMREHGVCESDEDFLMRRAKVHAMIDEYGVTTIGPHITIFHDHYASQFHQPQSDIEAGIAIVRAQVPCPHIRSFGGFSCVTGCHVGDYSSMEMTYDAMVQWAQKNQLQLANTAVEEYLVGATMTQRHSNYVTKLYLPLAGSAL